MCTLTNLRGVIDGSVWQIQSVREREREIERKRERKIIYCTFTSVRSFTQKGFCFFSVMSLMCLDTFSSATTTRSTASRTTTTTDSFATFDEDE